MESSLIFDVGMHRGEDTEYYLARGFRVVAVDADPAMIAQAADRFSEAVRDGRLVLVHAAVGDDQGEVEFHLSDQTIWSSRKPQVSARERTETRTIRVPSRRLDDLFREHGVPYYCKIDIEGWDVVCLRSLEEADELPSYISAESECVGDSEEPTEEETLAVLEQLGRLGYRRFKLVDQQSLAVLPPSGRAYRERPPAWERVLRRLGLNGQTPYNFYELWVRTRSHLNGVHGYTFPDMSTGPFGADLAGEWLDLETARRMLLRHRRDYQRMAKATRYGFWCDWHATI